MKLRLLLVALLGVGLAAYLIFSIGFAAVFSAALRVGWSGFAVICAYGLVLYVVLGGAWNALVPDEGWRRLKVFVWGRIVRDSAAEVLPFSQVGGFVIGARATILRGVQAPIAFASTIVDITTEMMSQIAYVALGLALLLERAPMTPFTVSLVSALLVGLVGAAVVGGIFIFLQQRGTWLTDKLASRALPNTIAHAAAIAEALSAIYRAPRRVALSLAIHLVAWIASAAGSWIALRLMGVNVDLLAVIALDSLVYAIRSAAFVVPNALGVQEAAYATLAPLLGVGPELGVYLRC